MGVECSSAAEALAAAGAGADIVLLDNLAPQVSPKIGGGRGNNGETPGVGLDPKNGRLDFQNGDKPQKGGTDLPKKVGNAIDLTSAPTK